MAATIDFHRDFRELVDRVLNREAVETDPSESYNDAIYRFYANRRRRIATQPHQIKESAELRCPVKLERGYAQLKDELTRGLDVNARLSRKLPDATFEDRSLNDWGITHFHLGKRKLNGSVNGTNPVLFAYVRGFVVYCIGFYDHKRSWANTEVLEILQRNWPEAIEHARVYGVTGYDGMTEAQRTKLRYQGGTVLTTVNGIVYAPPGGGYTTAGTSMRAHREADHAILTVAAYEKYFLTNLSVIVKDFKARGLQIGPVSRFSFGFSDDGKAIAIEKNTGGCVVLGDFPQ